MTLEIRQIAKSNQDTFDPFLNMETGRTLGAFRENAGIVQCSRSDSTPHHFQKANERTDGMNERTYSKGVAVLLQRDRGSDRPAILYSITSVTNGLRASLLDLYKATTIKDGEKPFHRD